MVWIGDTIGPGRLDGWFAIAFGLGFGTAIADEKCPRCGYPTDLTEDGESFACGMCGWDEDEDGEQQ